MLDKKRRPDLKTFLFLLQVEVVNETPRKKGKVWLSKTVASAHPGWLGPARLPSAESLQPKKSRVGLDTDFFNCVGSAGFLPVSVPGSNPDSEVPS